MYCTCPNIIDSQQYYGPLQNLEMRIHRNIFMQLSPLWIFPLRILEFVVRKFHQRPSETGCVCLVNVDIFLVKQLTGVNETWKDAFLKFPKTSVILQTQNKTSFHPCFFVTPTSPQQFFLHLASEGSPSTNSAKSSGSTLTRRDRVTDGGGGSRPRKAWDGVPWCGINHENQKNRW